MLHEYMVTQQLKLQQKRIDWVNRNAWMFYTQTQKVVEPTVLAENPNTQPCCA
jgi:hypothetical protein